jgi:hypothetical protein
MCIKRGSAAKERAYQERENIKRERASKERALQNRERSKIERVSLHKRGHIKR